MADPGYRTDIDWTVYQVCGYDHNIVKRSEYTRHHLTSHGGLESERNTHATVCKIASEHEGREKCICRLNEYEALASAMALERKNERLLTAGEHMAAMIRNAIPDGVRECDGPCEHSDCRLHHAAALWGKATAV